jgi:pimeloyl-ACP methyl ester carboxylesterase
MLVHGYGGSTFDWRFQGETLARAGVETWALDLPPFGWSALEDPFPKGAAARARLLAACLDAVDLSRGRETGGAWILVGHSLGSRVVSYFAIEHPARVDRLVLVSPAMTTWIPSFGVLDWPLVRGIAGAVTRAYVGSDGAMRIIMRKAYGREPTKEEEAGHDAPYRRPGSAEAFMAWNAAPKELTGPEPGAIPCPVLVVFGDRDRIADPAQGPKIVAALPGSRLVIVPGGGHLVLESQHEEVSAAILAWLDEIAPQEKKN